MLELSRHGDREPDDPLRQPFPAHSSLKVIVPAIVAFTFAFFAYNGIKRGIPEEEKVLPPEPQVPASALPEAPYSALRSDARPGMNSIVKAQRAAEARLEATGGKTANASRIDTRAGGVVAETPAQRLFKGLTTRAQVNAAASDRLALLTADAESLRAKLQQSRPTEEVDQMLNGVEALRGVAATQVATLLDPDLPEDRWLGMRETAANSLVQLQDEMERTKAIAVASAAH